MNFKNPNDFLFYAFEFNFYASSFLDLISFYVAFFAFLEFGWINLFVVI